MRYVAYIINKLKYLSQYHKYHLKNDYQSKRYWNDRYGKAGLSFSGPGHGGISEEENLRQYEQGFKVFLKLCQENKVNFKQSKVLEIGIGNGFYVKKLSNLGLNPHNYLGIDISDIAVLNLSKIFKKENFKFKQFDICSEKINSKFDLIFMIDVEQHIINDIKFRRAMENIKKMLKQGAVFIITSNLKSQKGNFYEKYRLFSTWKEIFAGYSFSSPKKLRDKYIFSITSPKDIQTKGQRSFR